MKWACNPQLCQTPPSLQSSNFDKFLNWNFGVEHGPLYGSCDICRSLNRDFMNEFCEVKKIIAIKGLKYDTILSFTHFFSNPNNKNGRTGRTYIKNSRFKNYNNLSRSPCSMLISERYREKL